ncbi:hypothetical protein GCM10022240_15660 [Microbacterium kribbense]|uniref:SseB protein N-terminal domain-containing protein n=1 Tax=Microbacterium kribbense TaxID=433645 RepID=A0ABP7GLK8_9MICO
MALFSRGPKAGDSSAQPPTEADVAEGATQSPGAADVSGAVSEAAAQAPAAADDAAAQAPAAGDAAAQAPAAGDAAAAEATAAASVDEEAPAVTISTTSYSGFGAVPATAAPAPTGEAPEPVETIPGLPDNVVLRSALNVLAESPEGHEVLNVARQLLQGNVYLRVQGNAQELMDAGAELPLAIANRDDGQFVLVYSSGEALAAAVKADGDTETSAMGQPAPAALQYALQNNFAGVIVDHASAPAAVVLPRVLIERIFAEMDPALVLKQLVVGPRTSETAAAVAEALTAAPLWIAVNRESEEADWGVAESRTDVGDRVLPIFSHPLEVVALGRGDRPMPFTAAQLGSALRGDEGINGVVVDPAGPWIRLDRADLAPVLALPEPEPDEQIEDEGDGDGGAADSDEAVDPEA